MKTTVVIPVLHARVELERVLDDLLNQTVLPDEIVIVDGESDLEDGDIQQLIESANVKINWVSLAGSTISQARNHGVSVARGSWILFTDAGCRLDQTLLQTFHSLAKDQSRDTIFYSPVEAEIQDRFQVVSASLLLPSVKYQQDQGYPSTRSLFVSKKLFFKRGGFDEGLVVGEDHDWLVRAEKAGIRFQSTNSALTRWSPPRSSSELLYKVARYAFYDGLAGTRPRLLLSYGARIFIFLTLILFSQLMASAALALYLAYSLVRSRLLSSRYLRPLECISLVANKVLIDIVVPTAYLSGRVLSMKQRRIQR